ncbi:hypothetical protein QYE76_007952 [Lolium multiflorum]|uniref:Uncharacterized protein n=1 Tax=Lolium multiflorum TaxID=4521 RepID=A0AAD8QG55_LOLMU|nr:hypothetical protein QYE76_007952 [Lolium multiflorum]
MDGAAAMRRLLRWKQRQGPGRGQRPMRRLLRWKQRQGPGRGGGRCAGCYVGSSDRGTGAAADAPAATLEATGAWTGRRPMRRLLRWKQRQGLDGAAADAPTMGISFFSIAGGFLRGFFFGCGEDDGTGEAVAVSQ